MSVLIVVLLAILTITIYINYKLREYKSQAETTNLGLAFCRICPFLYCYPGIVLLHCRLDWSGFHGSVQAGLLQVGSVLHSSSSSLDDVACCVYFVAAVYLGNHCVGVSADGPLLAIEGRIGLVGSST